jgi:hypothetical protein
MQMHGFSPRTHRSYVAAVLGLAKCAGRSPDTLQASDLHAYFEHLVVERRLAPASVSLTYHGIRFLYLQVLNWPAVDLEVVKPQAPPADPGAPLRVPRSRRQASLRDGAAEDLSPGQAAGRGNQGRRHPRLDARYATNQSAAGPQVERLQRLMGHACIQTTLR